MPPDSSSSPSSSSMGRLSSIALKPTVNEQKYEQIEDVEERHLDQGLTEPFARVLRARCPKRKHDRRKDDRQQEKLAQWRFSRRARARKLGATLNPRSGSFPSNGVRRP